MTIQYLLIVVLLGLAAILATLLYVRLRREKRFASSLKAMKLDDFAAFLRSNSEDGAIQQVASKVSDLLKGPLGCERIIFLRKKRGVLELNYYHGIRRFNRRDFRIRFSRQLTSQLSADFLPRPVEDLKPHLPVDFYHRISEVGFDVVFPIYWRDNLYGIYFVRSSRRTDSKTFNMLIASLAQSLSAAYHIKWHETKYDELQKKLVDIGDQTRQTDLAQETTIAALLKLIKQRKSDSLVSAIVELLNTELGMSNVAFMYESRNDGKAQLVFRGEGKRTLKIPSQASFDEVVAAIGSNDVMKIDNLAGKSASLQIWAKDFMQQGLKYATALPLAPDRTGVLVWGGRPANSINRELDFLKAHAVDLLDNAESYEKIEELSYTDSLTRLSNQRYFHKRLEEEINRCQRYDRQLALIFFDLDDLKHVNDTYGHLAGDSILRQLGEILRQSIRSIDIVARYGGDEFCVIMPEADEDTCIQFMKRLKAEVNRAQFTADGVPDHINCTVSLGGAVFPDHADEAKKLIHLADMALLRAKEAGRDRCLLYEHQ
jgi:diguanylate cyclase (GGDEF)-like protein